ncbi:MAG: hydroxysqualene dehydroxylase HpnE [Sphingomonadales bacterium]|nr:hydroxysqualene dehydroxylase HpnE [Sphingomonadales bacterium]
MTLRRVTVAGAGLAGLQAAVTLAQAGVAVTVSDSAARAGGRCRSYRDAMLGLTIDNGNHLVLSGNRAVAAFRETIGADEPLAGPDHAAFVFMDLASGERWTVTLSDGRIPWWLFNGGRRVPHTSPRDYAPLLRLLKGGHRRIDALIPPEGPVWHRLLRPVLLAALNTEPAEASAELAANVLAESVMLGGRASIPRIAVPTLAAAFIDPAVGWLARNGVPLATGRRLRALATDGARVTALEWSDGRQDIAADEAVILAVPPWVAAELVPGLTVPDQHRAILNAHFAIAPPAGAPAMLGLLNATSEWVFTHANRVSVTVSAADWLMDADREDLAWKIWREVVPALGFAPGQAADLPPWQVVKEKRATFAATPEQEARRPHPATGYANLFLAGDWVRTGLPATIEGSLRAGDNAARLALGQSMRYGVEPC